MRLACEVLEDRTVPAQIEWVGLSSVGYFHDVNNWVIQGTQINQLPGLNDDVNINVDGVVATIYYDAALLPVENRSFQSVTSNEKLVIDGYFALIGSQSQGHMSTIAGPLEINPLAQVEVGLNNDDTLLNLDGGAVIYGAVNVGANATVDVRAATATLGTGSVVAGPGTVSVSVSVTGTLDVTFGTNFNKLVIKPGATVNSSVDFNVIDRLTWEGGILNPTGTVTVAALTAAGVGGVGGTPRLLNGTLWSTATRPGVPAISS